MKKFLIITGFLAWVTANIPLFLTFYYYWESDNLFILLVSHNNQYLFLFLFFAIAIVSLYMAGNLITNYVTTNYSEDLIKKKKRQFIISCVIGLMVSIGVAYLSKISASPELPTLSSPYAERAIKAHYNILKKINYGPPGFLITELDNLKAKLNIKDNKHWMKYNDKKTDELIENATQLTHRIIEARIQGIDSRDERVTELLNLESEDLRTLDTALPYIQIFLNPKNLDKIKAIYKEEFTDPYLIWTNFTEEIADFFLIWIFLTFVVELIIIKNNQTQRKGPLDQKLISSVLYFSIFILMFGIWALFRLFVIKEIELTFGEGYASPVPIIGAILLIVASAFFLLYIVSSGVMQHLINLIPLAGLLVAGGIGIFNPLKISQNFGTLTLLAHYLILIIIIIIILGIWVFLLWTKIPSKTQT